MNNPLEGRPEKLILDVLESCVPSTLTIYAKDMLITLVKDHINLQESFDDILSAFMDMQVENRTLMNVKSQIEFVFAEDKKSKGERSAQ
jgi:hypothetical protein